MSEARSQRRPLASDPPLNSMIGKSTLHGHDGSEVARQFSPLAQPQPQGLNMSTWGDLGQPGLGPRQFFGVRLNQGHAAEARVAARDHARQFPGTSAGVNEVVVAIERRKREDELAVMFGLPFWARGPRRIVEIVPVGVFPRFVHARRPVA